MAFNLGTPNNFPCCILEKQHCVNTLLRYLLNSSHLTGYTLEFYPYIDPNVRSTLYRLIVNIPAKYCLVAFHLNGHTLIFIFKSEDDLTAFTCREFFALCHHVFDSIQPHILNVCVHELLLVTLIEEQIVSEDTCEDATRTKISSFLKTDTNTGEPWCKLLCFIVVKSCLVRSFPFVSLSFPPLPIPSPPLPSRYLFAIGLSCVFSLGWDSPPDWDCTPKQPDSPEPPRAAGAAEATGLSPSRMPPLSGLRLRAPQRTALHATTRQTAIPGVGSARFARRY